MNSRTEKHYNFGETNGSNKISFQGAIEISPLNKIMQSDGNEKQSREAKSPIRTIKEYQVVQKQNDNSETKDAAIQTDDDLLRTSLENSLPDDLIATNQSNDPNSPSVPFPSEHNTQCLNQKPTNLLKCRPARSFHLTQQHRIVKRSKGKPSAVNLMRTLLHIKDSALQNLENGNKVLSAFANLAFGIQPGQTEEYLRNSQEHLQQHADQQNDNQLTVDVNYETPILPCEMNTVININLSILKPGTNILIKVKHNNHVIRRNPTDINIQNFTVSEEQITFNLEMDVTNANDDNSLVSI